MNARHRLDLLLESYTGIEVTRGGIDSAIDAFLTRRLAETRAASLDDYLARLAPRSAELQLMLDAITVTYSWFMRDPGQLAIVSELLAKRRESEPPLRAWVAGCAAGEDVYSVALLAEQAGRDVRVLGTDINRAALRSAELGCYSSWALRELSDVERYFEPAERGRRRISERFRQRVRFEHHNLLDPPPSGDWDLILCRNVLIYISRERARGVVERLADALSPGGLLLLGASEVVFDVPPQLEALYVAGRLALRRSPPSSARRSTRPPRSSLIPRASSAGWHAPVPALPRAAAQIVEPERRPPASTSPVDALLAQGHDLLDRSELAPATQAYRAAVELDTTLPAPHMYLGIALYLDGEVEAALHELRAAAFLEPELWPASFYLAVCHEALGQLEAATREYRHVVRTASRVGAAHLPRRHSAWHRDLVELARRRAGNAA